MRVGFTLSADEGRDCSISELLVLFHELKCQRSADSFVQILQTQVERPLMLSVSFFTYHMLCNDHPELQRQEFLSNTKM